MNKMKKWIPVLSAMVIVLAASFPALAQSTYVNPITKITMRTGPGVGNKIVAMLPSGTKLEVLEGDADWSRVQLENGKMGWVLTRFLSEKIPVALLAAQLKKENAGLASALKKSEETNRTLSRENASLLNIDKKYQKLQKESADYLKLKADYTNLLETSEIQKEEISVLEADVNNERTLWFLSGAGVFIVGLIMGLSSRKRRTSSLL